MKKKFAKILAGTLCLIGFYAHAGLLMTYKQLTLKDVDQMHALVTGKIKESKKSKDGKVVPLKECLQAIYSRPNSDGMINKIIAPIRSELEAVDALDRVYKELVDEAVNALKHPNNFKPDAQVTYLIFLENIVSDFKPMAGNEGFEKQILEKIQKAKIEVSKKAQNERKLNQMQNNLSPSELAEQILNPPPLVEKKSESKLEPKLEK